MERSHENGNYHFWPGKEVLGGQHLFAPDTVTRSGSELKKVQNSTSGPVTSPSTGTAITQWCATLPDS